ncbi:MAG: alpha/beta hydrolase [Proteobacteria bacterium]|nr:alpha/beta hydrolase [Pseudomonadota bacterium]
MDKIEITARGMTFTALCEGPEDGPLLILLHGLTRTSWEWHHQIPVLASLGYRTVAMDLRGRPPDARPMAVEDYVISEFMADTLAVADQLAGEGSPFHLMATSIGAMIAWHIAAEHPTRIKTLACINIAHPGAFLEVAARPEGERQRERMSYVEDSSIEGNERAIFEATLARIDLPEAETAPYREVYASEEAIRAAFHWYRARPLDSRNTMALPPVPMPTMFLWPPGAGNVSRETAEANAHFVTGPYRFEVLEKAQNYALQAEPERVTGLLAAHLSAHGG